MFVTADEMTFEHRNVCIKKSKWVTEEYDVTDLLLGR